MKANRKKPILIFLGVVFIVSALVIHIKNIQLPIVSSLGDSKNKSKNTGPQMAPPTAEDGKILIKYSELDIFMSECCGSAVKNVKSDKNGDSVRLHGQATLPFPSDFSGDIEPYVEDDKVKVKISNLVLGKVESPKILSDKLSELVNLGFDEKINSKYKVKDVKIEGDGIEIEIR